MSILTIAENTALQLLLNMKVKFGGTIRTKSSTNTDEYGKTSKHNVTLNIGNDDVYFTVIRHDMEFGDEQSDVHVELLYQGCNHRVNDTDDVEQLLVVLLELHDDIIEDGYYLADLMPYPIGVE